ncbi:MAG: response regulator [Pirellulales bacterium]
MNKCFCIAIADDDLVVRTLLKRQLTDSGHTVVLEANSGQELLHGLSSVAAELVISDIHMAKLDGIDAADLIMARYGLPVIFISGLDFHTIQHRLGDCHAHAYLMKPFQPQQLQAAIMFAMQRFEEMRSLRGEVAGLRQILEDRKLVEQTELD